MTTKHTKQKYTERQTRLGAKNIKGAYEEVRSDTRLAKEKARSLTIRPIDALIHIHKQREESSLILEFIPYRKRRRKKIIKRKNRS
ncbi:MAG: hypothetical protein BGO67_02675 [Alphaproteobacteria bacterium 41-28]|nr:MAG: hypothetical protein BGO67_02675 [Alphaproteobacteria bacterium 41-28]